jgi:hypothetical protein
MIVYTVKFNHTVYLMEKLLEYISLFKMYCRVRIRVRP